MAIQHVDITDPQIHEPKGASAAGANTVYVADGSGSGAWLPIGPAQIDMTTLAVEIQSDIGDGTIDLKGQFLITGVIPDVSAVSSILIALPKNGTVKNASFVLGGAITTANALVNIKNAAGVNMGSNATIAFSGSGKGSQFAWTATGNNVLTAPTWIEVTSDGGSDTSVPCYFTIVFEYVAN